MAACSVGIPCSVGGVHVERKPHDDFVGMRADAVYGRDTIRNRVLAYIQKGESRVLLELLRSTGVMRDAMALGCAQRAIVSCLAEEEHPLLMLEGEAGAGKSALIASCVQTVRERLSHLKVFHHFVGAAPGSTDLVRLLHRMWLEIAPDQAAPPTEDGLVRNVPELLSRAGREGGVVVFIDALNQLDADAELSQLRWLPMLLPAGVRCVVSVIGSTTCHEMLCNRSPQPLRIPVGPLDREACEQLVNSAMSHHPGVLGDLELRQLVSKLGARNPLWLVSACEELKLTVADVKADQSVSDKIAAFPDDLLGMLQQILLRVGKEHDETLITAALCLLECSRHGLFETELRALLADERKCKFVETDCSAVCLPDLTSDLASQRHVGALKGKLHTEAQMAVQGQVLDTNANEFSPAAGGTVDRQTEVITEKQLTDEVWHPLFQSLQPFLRPCSSKNHLDFFHRAVSKAVRLAHLQDEQRYTFWHGRLADFFERSEDSQRRAEELPYHLEKVLDNSRLLRSLVQWDVFSSLAVSAHGFELLRYSRVVGGYGVLATAITEQLKVWSAGGQLSEEDLMLRKCVVAEFLTKAGLNKHAIALLRDGEKARLRPDIDARRLGLLADAMLCSACFDAPGDLGEYNSIAGLLERAVSLWRRVDAADEDEAALAQALSNLCFHHNQTRKIPQALEAGKEAIEIFTRLRHPRLAQAEQHLGHVYHSMQQNQQALELYKQSASTFESMGTAKFDTEYACTLSAIATTLFETCFRDNAPPPYLAVLAWQRAAVASCEAITGQDHAEATYFRQLLVQLLAHSGYDEEAQQVEDGEEVAVTAEDMVLMRGH